MSFYLNVIDNTKSTISTIWTLHLPYSLYDVDQKYELDWKHYHGKPCKEVDQLLTNKLKQLLKLQETSYNSDINDVIHRVINIRDHMYYYDQYMLSVI